MVYPGCTYLSQLRTGELLLLDTMTVHMDGDGEEETTSGCQEVERPCGRHMQIFTVALALPTQQLSAAQQGLLTRCHSVAKYEDAWQGCQWNFSG